MVLIAAVLGLSGCGTSYVINAMVPTSGYTVTHNIAYASGPRHKLDVYRPVNATGHSPVVIYIYGGRWRAGDKSTYKFAAEALTSHGYVVVIPNYRLFPEVHFPAYVQDAAQAVAWTHAHVADFGGDPNEMYLLSHSAGAQIGALLALDPAYLAAVGGSPNWFAGVVCMSGPYDFNPDQSWDLAENFGPRSHYPQAMAVNFVTGHNPPMLLMAGKDDQEVPYTQSVELYRRIKAAGGPVQLKLFNGLGHVELIATFANTLHWIDGRPLSTVEGFVDRRVARREQQLKMAKDTTR
jgi:acetyl esterase/lipase